MPKNSPKSLERAVTRTKQKQQRSQQPRRKRNPPQLQSSKPPRKTSQRTHGVTAASSPLTWTHGSDSTPTTTKTNRSNTSGPSSPPKLKRTTPCGMVLTSTPMSSPWISWPPTLSAVCINVLKNSASMYVYFVPSICFYIM